MNIIVQLVRKGWVVATQGNVAVHVRGQAHLKDKFLDTKSLAKRFCVTSIGALDTLVSELNGNWAVVVVRNGAVFLAVDHLRSIQILYRIENGELFVFDDVSEFKKSHRLEMDESCVHEYLSSGYVYGSRTLYKGVISLQAAERVMIRSSSSLLCPEVSSLRYWRYIPNVDRPITVDDSLVDRVEETFKSAIQHLVESVGERRIVVPLSGGYDSRLIVNYLYKVGFRKVLCYSYGAMGNKEACISRQVAERLGYEWHFVEYTAEMRAALAQEERQCGVYRYMTNGVNRYCQQEYIALRDLKAHGTIDPMLDVIVPGYYFDYLAGSHVAPWVLNCTAASEMCEWENNFFPRRHFLASIKAVRRVFKENADVPAKLFYEGWAWQERLTKFIVNNVRSFECLGFDWRLPLCDRELFDLWLAVPYCLRYDRTYFFSIFSTLTVPEIRDCPIHGKISRTLFRRVRRYVGLRVPYFVKYFMSTLRGGTIGFSGDSGASRSDFISWLAYVSELFPSCKFRLQNVAHITSNAEFSLKGLALECGWKKNVR